VSYQGRRFELPYALSGKTVQLVVDPHAQRVVGVEDDEGQSLGEATPLDALGNAHRARHKAGAAGADLAPRAGPGGGPNLVEIAHRRHHGVPDEQED